MDVYSYFEEQIPQVNRVLDEVIPAADAEPAQLHAAMRHILFPGGKRLRPVLAIAAAEAVGSPGECALPLAAAVELVHTYSLVHDDLPCMDDDDERRGVPSVHVAFGEAVAVLAGDALLASAFEVLAKGAPGLEPDRVVAASLELSRAAGSLALVGGQVEDLVFDASDTNVERIERVHARKSAALIAASIVGGALLGGADAETAARLKRCGVAAGIAFQIADDVLDEGEDDPCSLVRAIGVDAARERAEKLLTSALAELEELGEKAEPLRELVRFSVRRKV
ncbi:MAG: polyprenyl synthetase family protein [Deltaproteobacteria bacterium]|nr:polyprenyl synthetase family protein [Deltaproteobacteria bacterium]MBW2540782.1 polyprenyl synthetase family protein [Deltaproteobacteria bacterium]